MFHLPSAKLRAALISAVALAAVLSGYANSTVLAGETSANNASTAQAPTLEAVNPPSLEVSLAPVVANIEGANFTGSSVVQVNGTARETEFVSTTVLRVSLAPSDVDSAGSRVFTVHTDGGGTSNRLEIPVVFSLSDYNCAGSVTSADVLQALQLIAGIPSVSGPCESFNPDSRVGLTMADVLVMRRVVAGLPGPKSTPTPSSTATPAPSNTATRVPTSAATSTSTATPVATNTPTATPSPALSATPTPTSTPTAVPTSVPGNTPTQTSTVVAPTPTSTSTPSPIGTPTPTATATPAAPLVRSLESFTITRNSAPLLIPIYTSQDVLTSDFNVQRAVIVIHGSSRNADDYWRYAADAVLGTPGMVVVAPKFSEIDDSPPITQIYWGSGWRDGDQSELDGRPWTISSFEVMDELLATLDASFPQLDTISLVGNSAGGQYVQRYAATRDDPRIEYIVGAPSSYMYLSADRPGTTCSKYNEYKYGLEDLNDTPYMEAIGAALLLDNYRQANITYLVGSDDDDPNDSSLDTGCKAMAQGAHRRERAEQFFAHIGDVFGSTIYESQSFAIVPGVAHEGRKLINSDVAKAILRR